MGRLSIESPSRLDPRARLERPLQCSRRPARSATGVRGGGVVVSISDVDSDIDVAALQCGALDIAQKPTALATDRLFEISDVLIRKVITAASARPYPPLRHAMAPAIAPLGWRMAPGQARVLVIGARAGHRRACRSSARVPVIGASTRGAAGAHAPPDGAAGEHPGPRRDRAPHPLRLHRVARPPHRRVQRALGGRGLGRSRRFPCSAHRSALPRGKRRSVPVSCAIGPRSAARQARRPGTSAW
jgi:hypothetical protein